jgi:Spy/CpxP family protein refolding chaperone
VSLRNISFVFLFVCLSVAAFGQGDSPSSAAPHHGMMRMWGMTSDQRIDRALDTLQSTLNLSPSQVTSIRQLAQSRRDSFKSIREQAKPKFNELMTLLKQPNPDPAAVGRIVIDLKATHEQARAKQMDLEKQFLALLNPTQQQIVNNLRNQAQTFRALRALGMLGAPEFPGGVSTSNLNPGGGGNLDSEY